MVDDEHLPILYLGVTALPGAQEAREEVTEAASAFLGRASFSLLALLNALKDGGGPPPEGLEPDRIEALRAVTGMGAELVSGAADMLRTARRYAAATLVRQVLELEYLACIISDEWGQAEAWLRADGEARRRFWSPNKLRDRASRMYLPTDYWIHCDLGGHPSPDGVVLLPDLHHHPLGPEAQWADLAGHATGLCHSIMKTFGPIDTPNTCATEAIRTVDAVAHWRAVDPAAPERRRTNADSDDD